ncbi:MULTISPECIES: phosphopantothenate--cysteine ligase [unclassified Lactococcus]|uniref:phosphopantothenate--cysteine ligase n=1 Tax=unclassified Lactococcus TaxID=2643510 RepID=UPI0011CB983B|nr:MULTISPECIES: phosphopantothenate--cysteine ligase [unclassified Lactococcus]MQW23681.1 phosphopantothenate--cysteine ligase [Lactococcus sp. dk101]TXK37514.1 phosphopantothenate--cysteine ligase [Lactococcus sp. dk310]TXK48968.1 phosphopantothenate--cysteine ligase [Lactococcus sp. dk322]
MKILITAGGTTEPIDTVRGITNFATGSLGKLTAEAFLQASHQVILLAGQTAVIPEPHKNLTVRRIMDTQDLMESMADLVPQVDVVIHSMAVSDYRPVYMTGLEQFSEQLSRQELLDFRPQTQENKISSKADFQIMLLEKTPKVIQEIKKWKPSVILFGFKLLSGVTETHLLNIAKEKMNTTKADFIVANDLATIKNGQHKAFILDKQQRLIQLNTKQEIANKIVEKAQEAYHG